MPQRRWRLGEQLASANRRPALPRKEPIVQLDYDLLDLLRKPSICFLATSMADGW